MHPLSARLVYIMTTLCMCYKSANETVECNSAKYCKNDILVPQGLRQLQSFIPPNQHSLKELHWYPFTLSK